MPRPNVLSQVFRSCQNSTFTDVSPDRSTRYLRLHEQITNFQSVTLTYIKGLLSFYHVNPLHKIYTFPKLVQKGIVSIECPRCIDVFEGYGWKNKFLFLNSYLTVKLSTLLICKLKRHTRTVPRQIRRKDFLDTRQKSRRIPSKNVLTVLGHYVLNKVV